MKKAYVVATRKPQTAPGMEEFMSDTKPTTPQGEDKSKNTSAKGELVVRVLSSYQGRARNSRKVREDEGHAYAAFRLVVTSRHVVKARSRYRR